MLTIENYGRRWNRDKIVWGKGSNKGHLKGELKRKRSTIVDFRLQIGIYVLFAATGEAVYVGESGIGNKRLFGQLKDHRGDYLRDRWTHFSWFGLRGYNEKSKEQVKLLAGYHKPETAIRKKNRRDALHEIEAVLISVVEPSLNRQGSKWNGSYEFLQFRDPSLAPSSNEIIAALPLKLADLAAKVDKLKEKLEKR